MSIPTAAAAPSLEGLLWGLGLIVLIGAFVGVSVLIDKRRLPAETRKTPTKAIHVPHRSGPVIVFPTRMIRLWCRFQLFRQGRTHLTSSTRHRHRAIRLARRPDLLHSTHAGPRDA